MGSFIKKVISHVMDFVLYTLLTEKQKKTVSNLISENHKNRLRELFKYGKKHARKQKIKKLKQHLYNLGFIQKALSEMEELYYTTNDDEMRRLVAWELSLWHANQYTRENARQALSYLPVVIKGEKNPDQLRRAAIIQAECLDMLQDPAGGKKVINDVLTTQHHPDLYLAAANLEESSKLRTEWINKVMESYQLAPIKFASPSQSPTYDDLLTQSTGNRIKKGPKVSVILPAYNAEEGIRIAIESILSQTWENIELLIVDDCSPDDTVTVIKEYMRKDSRIKLFSTPVNSGPYVARNIALKEATGEYVTINDSDDWSHAEKIEIQVSHLMNNNKVIANTSEHARLTEDLKLYRRGTPGRYIFSNMSSLMFRRKEVHEKLGYWDNVRFAADGEFKRRLIKTFGKQRIVDLKTGPLSLPRQSVSSLTGSSAFGYNGFFMGVRKEYVESLEFFHQQAHTLYYPYPEKKRPFPVPEPMWPIREKKISGMRHFDVVIGADYRLANLNTMKEIKRQTSLGNRVGLMQLSQYDPNIKSGITDDFRSLIDGEHIQMLVYGERINSDLLLIMDPVSLKDYQKYIPEIKTDNVHVLVNQLPVDHNGRRVFHMQACQDHVKKYFGRSGIWHPETSQIRKILVTRFADEIHDIQLSNNSLETMGAKP